MLRKIVSFGFRHQGGGPNATPGVLVIDVRNMLRNPFHNPKLRGKNGLDPEVQQDIMKTPNFEPIFKHLLERVKTPGVDLVYVGCTGGHHRSVFIAELLGRHFGVPVEHRDINKR